MAAESPTKRARGNPFSDREVFNKQLLEQAGYVPISGAGDMIRAFEELLPTDDTYVVHIHVDLIRGALARMKKLVPLLSDDSAKVLFLRHAVKMFEILASRARVDSCFLTVAEAAALRNINIIRAKHIELTTEFWASSPGSGAASCTARVLRAVEKVQNVSDSVLDALHEIGGKSMTVAADAWRHAEECCNVADHWIQKCNEFEKNTLEMPISFCALATLCVHEAYASESRQQRICSADVGASLDFIDIYLKQHAPPAE